MNPEWTDNHLPIKPFLDWPIYSNYQITSLYDYINLQTKQKDIFLTFDQWELIEQLHGIMGFVDPSVDERKEVLSRVPLIFCDDLTISKRYDPFGIGYQDILEDFAAIGIESDSKQRIKRIKRFLKKYGVPFSLDQPLIAPAHEPTFYVDMLTSASRHVEQILYDAFQERVIMVGHFVWRSKEMGIVEKLVARYSEEQMGLNMVDIFKDIIPEGVAVTDENIYSVARNILSQRMTEYIGECKNMVKPEEMPSVEISALKIYMQPPDLLSGLWIKLNQAVLVNGTMTTCLNCGNPLLKNRQWSTYCSEACGARIRQIIHRAPEEKRGQVREMIKNRCPLIDIKKYIKKKD